MTVHKFDFETIHLQVLRLSLDMLLELQKMPEMEPKLTADHHAAAEKLRAVFDIAMDVDKMDLGMLMFKGTKYDNIKEFIKDYSKKKTNG